ncbi:unnamed protein product [Ectocarpus sp. 13 AM-2016]
MPVPAARFQECAERESRRDLDLNIDHPVATTSFGAVDCRRRTPVFLGCREKTDGLTTLELYIAVCSRAYIALLLGRLLRISRNNMFVKSVQYPMTPIVPECFRPFTCGDSLVGLGWVVFIIASSVGLCTMQ